MPGPVKIIANPVSGRGRGGRQGRAVVEDLRRAGCPAELFETVAPGDASRLATDVAGFGAVACLGGDGTINEVLNGLPLDTAPPMGVIPCGTANVLAHELGIPSSIEGIARVLREGEPVPWDVGVDRLSGRRFLIMASAGYDAHVVHVFHAARRGPIRIWEYFLWGIASILKYEAPRIVVELDGRPVANDAAWVIVSNGAGYGGPLRFAHDARPDDGLFEVLIQRGSKRRDVVRMFAAALLLDILGIHTAMRDVTRLPARRVRLTSADGRPVPVQVDGDPSGHLPVDYDLLPRSIRLLQPTKETVCFVGSGPTKQTVSFVG